MRAPLRGGSRAGLRHAEPVSAGATDALENALRAVHTYRSADALRVVGHKRAGGRAQRVVGGVVVVLGGGASEAAEATRGEGRDATVVSWTSKCTLALRFLMAIWILP